MRTPSSPIAASGVILVAIALGALAARHRREHPPTAAIAIVAPAIERGGGDRERVDLNQADPEILERLPRIGPSLARRIVDDRTERGPFRTVDDLDRVRGIGPATLEAIRALVTVEPDVRPSIDAGASLAPPADDG